MKMLALVVGLMLLGAPLFAQTRSFEVLADSGPKETKEIHFTVRYAPGGKVSVKKLQLIAFVVEDQDGKPMTTALFPIVKKTKERGVYAAEEAYTSIALNPDQFALRIRAYFYDRGVLVDRVKVVVKSMATAPLPAATQSAAEKKD